MRNILFTFAGILLAGTAVATSEFLAPATQTLAEDLLDIPYDANLACGACIRSGNSYCVNKKDDKSVGRGAGDVCCNDDKCVMD